MEQPRSIGDERKLKINNYFFENYVRRKMNLGTNNSLFRYEKSDRIVDFLIRFNLLHSYVKYKYNCKGLRAYVIYEKIKKIY